MTAPRTGSISVPAHAGLASVRSRSRGFATTVGLALVRTPELTIGALGVAVAAAFAWVPSLWYDEAATVTSAQRSWGQLWAELHSVDAVHGLYYALMHAWFWLVGYSPFTLRFPSALAIGVAAGLLVALGRRLGGRRLGIVAGLVFIALPRVQWAGTEGRPYATITTFAVCLTLVGLTAVRRSRTDRALRWWLAYGALALVAVTFNVYLSLAVVSHGVALVWTLLVRRSAVRRTADPAEVAPPLVTRGSCSAGWSPRAPPRCSCPPSCSRSRPSRSRSPGSPASGSGPSTRCSRPRGSAARTPTPHSHGRWCSSAWSSSSPQPTVARPTSALVRAQAVRVALPLVVLPTATLVLATAMGKHLYSPKYASLSLPFVALLIALALTLVRPKALLAAAVAVVLVASIPAAVLVKQPRAKQDSVWASAAAFIASERGKNRADVDEGVVFGSVYGHPGATADIIRISYPAAFTGMTDLGVRKDGPESGVLWDQTGDLATNIPARLNDIDTVWFVGGTPKARNIQPETARILAEHGFHAEQHWKRGAVVVTEFVKG